MYLELTEQYTIKLLQEILIDSIPLFEFPRFDIFDYEEGELVEVIDPESGASSYEWVGGAFNSVLTKEEINIVAEDMIITWLNQQLKSTENIRQKYSGADFKFTSQANHMAKLMDLVKQEERETRHLQRLYKRRIADEDGIMRSTFDTIMKESPQGRKGIENGTYNGRMY